jgi:hypothetical protein
MLQTGRPKVASTKAEVSLSIGSPVNDTFSMKYR